QQAGCRQFHTGGMHITRLHQQNLTGRINFKGNTFTLQHFSNVLRVMVLQTIDRKSTRLNSSHVKISYAVFCLKKKKKTRKENKKSSVPPIGYVCWGLAIVGGDATFRG